MSRVLLSDDDIPYQLSSIEANTERIADALEKIARPDQSVRSMREHCAEHDHVLELRLIDVDVFAVRCARNDCHFRAEWRTR